jgi:hypothetical protein
MLQALVLAAGLGFLLGLRYRVPAVVVASAATAVMAPAVAYMAGASFWPVVLSPAAALVALQCGYLGGLALSFIVAGARPDRDAIGAERRLAAKTPRNEGGVVEAGPLHFAVRYPRWLTNLGCI